MAAAHRLDRPTAASRIDRCSSSTSRRCSTSRCASTATTSSASRRSTRPTALRGGWETVDASPSAGCSGFATLVEGDFLEHGRAVAGDDPAESTSGSSTCRAVTRPASAARRCPRCWAGPRTDPLRDPGEGALPHRRGDLSGRRRVGRERPQRGDGDLARLNFSCLTAGDAVAPGEGLRRSAPGCSRGTRSTGRSHATRTRTSRPSGASRRGPRSGPRRPCRRRSPSRGPACGRCRRRRRRRGPGPRSRSTSSGVGGRIIGHVEALVDAGVVLDVHRVQVLDRRARSRASRRRAGRRGRWRG